MGLARGACDDVSFRKGAFRERILAMRQNIDAHNLAIGIVYAFDLRTGVLLVLAGQLGRGPIGVCRGLGAARISMAEVGGGQQIDWAIKQLPSSKNLPIATSTALRPMSLAVGAPIEQN